MIAREGEELRGWRIEVRERLEVVRVVVVETISE